MSKQDESLEDDEAAVSLVGFVDCWLMMTSSEGALNKGVVTSVWVLSEGLVTLSKEALKGVMTRVST